MAAFDGDPEESIYREKGKQRLSEVQDSGKSFDADDSSWRTVGASLGEIKEGIAKIAGDLFSEYKGRMTEKCREMSVAIRQTGETLRSKDQEILVQYVNQAAEKVQRVSDYIASMESDRILPEVESAFQRKPMLFLGGTLVLGFVLGRLFKVSVPSTGQDTSPTISVSRQTEQ